MNAVRVDLVADVKVASEDTCVGCKVCTISCPVGTINYVQDTGKKYKNAIYVVETQPVLQHAQPRQLPMWMLIVLVETECAHGPISSVTKIAAPTKKYRKKYHVIGWKIASR